MAVSRVLGFWGRRAVRLVSMIALGFTASGCSAEEGASEGESAVAGQGSLVIRSKVVTALKKRPVDSSASGQGALQANEICWVEAGQSLTLRRAIAQVRSAHYLIEPADLASLRFVAQPPSAGSRPSEPQDSVDTPSQGPVCALTGDVFITTLSSHWDIPRTALSLLNEADMYAAQGDRCFYDPQKAASLARIAREGTRGNRRSMGRCWAYVDNAIEAYMRAYGRTSPADYGFRWPTMAASQWAQHAVGRQEQLKRNMHLRHVPELSNVDPANLPLGSVLVFNPGQCGFNGTYGHAEIKSSSNPQEFSSDYIQTGRSCRANDVFVPVTCQ